MSKATGFKPTAAQLYSIRAKGAEINIRMELNLPVIKWKEWKPEAATLRAWDRAQNPYHREPGDGRGGS